MFLVIGCIRLYKMTNDLIQCTLVFRYLIFDILAKIGEEETNCL